MNQNTATGYANSKSLTAVERTPTEIESEINEARSVCQSLTEAVSKLESRLASVTSVPIEKPEPNSQPRSVLTPLADSIRQLTDQNRDNLQRIFRLIDSVQVPY